MQKKEKGKKRKERRNFPPPPPPSPNKRMQDCPSCTTPGANRTLICASPCEGNPQIANICTQVFVNLENRYRDEILVFRVNSQTLAFQGAFLWPGQKTRIQVPLDRSFGNHRIILTFQVGSRLNERPAEFQLNPAADCTLLPCHMGFQPLDMGITTNIQIGVQAIKRSACISVLVYDKNAPPPRQREGEDEEEDKKEEEEQEKEEEEGEGEEKKKKKQEFDVGELLHDALLANPSEFASLMEGVEFMLSTVGLPLLYTLTNNNNQFVVPGAIGGANLDVNGKFRFTQARGNTLGLEAWNNATSSWMTVWAGAYQPEMTRGAFRRIRSGATRTNRFQVVAFENLRPTATHRPPDFSFLTALVPDGVSFTQDHGQGPREGVERNFYWPRTRIPADPIRLPTNPNVPNAAVGNAMIRVTGMPDSTLRTWMARIPSLRVQCCMGTLNPTIDKMLCRKSPFNTGRWQEKPTRECEVFMRCGHCNTNGILDSTCTEAERAQVREWVGGNNTEKVGAECGCFPRTAEELKRIQTLNKLSGSLTRQHESCLLAACQPNVAFADWQTMRANCPNACVQLRDIQATDDFVEVNVDANQLLVCGIPDSWNKGWGDAIRAAEQEQREQEEGIWDTWTTLQKVGIGFLSLAAVLLIVLICVVTTMKDPDERAKWGIGLGVVFAVFMVFGFLMLYRQLA